jgi:hypothetical protein
MAGVNQLSKKKIDFKQKKKKKKCVMNELLGGSDMT